MESGTNVKRFGYSSRKLSPRIMYGYLIMEDVLEHCSKSYNPASCCGDDCSFNWHATEEEPCWGDVEVIDEIYSETDWSWIHACQGHTNYDWTGSEKNIYIPEPNPLD